MSSSFLGGGDKGATSVLRNVGGRVDIDRSLHRDRYIPAQGEAGPFRHAAQRPANAHASSSRMASPPNAYDLSALRDHLVPQAPAGRQEDWASGFVPPQQQHAAASRQAVGPARTVSPWQQDFLQSQHQQPAQARQSQPGPAPWQTAPPSNMHQQQHPTYRPLPYQHYGPPPPPQHIMPMPLFPQADQQYRTEQESKQPDVQRDREQARSRPTEPLTESQEVLARTARELVKDVDASADLLRDNPKLAKSQFWELMSGLGDGEVVLQDDPVASAGDATGEGAKFVNRAEFQNWASDFLGAGASASAATATAGPSTSPAEVHQARTLPATLDTPDIYERQRMGMEAAWPDQEAITQSRPSGMQQRRKSVHFDDDQSRGAEAVERSGVPNSLEEALRSTTGVAGTSSQWEESGLDLDDFDETAFMNFNGPLRQTGSSRIGVGDLENWGGMQRDWDEFQRAEPALRQGQNRTDRYLFQSRNPYASMQGDADMGRESPTFKGVLELEAAVQQDPTDHEAWYALGLKQQENEREDQAIRALTKVLDLDPDYRPAYLALAVSYTNESEHDRSRAMMSKWIDMAESAGGQQYETEGLVGDALAHGRLVERLIDMARRSPEEVDPEVQIALGVLFNSSEEYVKAEDCFSAALSVRPDDWLLHNRLGATLANSGRSNEAVAYYHRALSLHPNFVRALFNLGISYINLAQYPLAAQHILSAIRLQHSDATEAYSSGTLGTSAKGVTSDALWNSLRTACLHMGRHDLVDLAARKDITAFPDTCETLDQAPAV